MKLIPTSLPEVILLEPSHYADHRGFFMEAWNKIKYLNLGLPENFVQDNLSFSKQGVLRGLHFQQPQPQGKLVFVLQGAVFDVAVDIRPDSPTFGQWVAETLTESNKRQLYVPEGFAHGFCIISPTALFCYKCTDFYNPNFEGGICWNDPDLNIPWPDSAPILSPKDAASPRLREIKTHNLPHRGGGL